MTYTRIAGDEEYRAVSLANSIVPKFTPFRNDGQTINYVGDTVLEIKRTDGSTSLVYDNGANQKRKVAVRRKENQIIVSRGIPTARMWLRDEATGIEYKAGKDSGVCLRAREDGYVISRWMEVKTSLRTSSSESRTASS